LERVVVNQKEAASEYWVRRKLKKGPSVRTFTGTYKRKKNFAGWINGVKGLKKAGGHVNRINSFDEGPQKGGPVVFQPGGRPKAGTPARGLKKKGWPNDTVRGCKGGKTGGCQRGQGHWGAVPEGVLAEKWGGEDNRGEKRGLYTPGKRGGGGI